MCERCYLCPNERTVVSHSGADHNASIKNNVIKIFYYHFHFVSILLSLPSNVYAALCSQHQRQQSAGSFIFNKRRNRIHITPHAHWCASNVSIMTKWSCRRCCHCCRRRRQLSLSRTRQTRPIYKTERQRWKKNLKKSEKRFNSVRINLIQRQVNQRQIILFRRPYTHFSWLQHFPFCRRGCRHHRQFFSVIIEWKYNTKNADEKIERQKSAVE